MNLNKLKQKVQRRVREQHRVDNEFAQAKMRRNNIKRKEQYYAIEQAKAELKNDDKLYRESRVFSDFNSLMNMGINNEELKNLIDARIVTPDMVRRRNLRIQHAHRGVFTSWLPYGARAYLNMRKREDAYRQSSFKIGDYHYTAMSRSEAKIYREIDIACDILNIEKAAHRLGSIPEPPDTSSQASKHGPDKHGPEGDGSDTFKASPKDRRDKAIVERDIEQTSRFLEHNEGYTPKGCRNFILHVANHRMKQQHKIRASGNKPKDPPYEYYFYHYDAPIKGFVDQFPNKGTIKRYQREALHSKDPEAYNLYAASALHLQRTRGCSPKIASWALGHNAYWDLNSTLRRHKSKPIDWLKEANKSHDPYAYGLFSKAARYLQNKRRCPLREAGDLLSQEIAPQFEENQEYYHEATNGRGYGAENEFRKAHQDPGANAKNVNQHYHGVTGLTAQHSSKDGPSENQPEIDDGGADL